MLGCDSHGYANWYWYISPITNLQLSARCLTCKQNVRRSQVVRQSPNAFLRPRKQSSISRAISAAHHLQSQSYPLVLPVQPTVPHSPKWCTTPTHLDPHTRHRRPTPLLLRFPTRQLLLHSPSSSSARHSKKEMWIVHAQCM